MEELGNGVNKPLNKPGNGGTIATHHEVENQIHVFGKLFYLGTQWVDLDVALFRLHILHLSIKTNKS